MSRTRIFITLIGFLVTFAWLLVPELKASPAVLWPSVLAVGLAFVTRDIYLSLFLGAFSGRCCCTAEIPGPRFTTC